MTESTLAFVFPGQGSQSLGMLAELSELHPQIRETFAEASEGVGVDLWALSQGGPEEMLNRTEYTQPALLAAGVAVWRLWTAQRGQRPALLAGHSLGEYTALVAAGALSLHDGAHLVRLRGQFMQLRHRRALARWLRCWAPKTPWCWRSVPRRQAAR